MSARKSRAIIERLELRRLLSVAVLTNGSGTPGAVSVGVDAYGAFGYTFTGVPTQYSDFSTGNIGVIDRSYVFFGPANKFLTSNDAANVEPITGSTPIPPTPVPGGSQPALDFSSTTAQSAVSTFTLSGTTTAGAYYSYTIVLNQTLSNIGPTNIQRYYPDESTKYQSTLIQTYSITNNLSTAQTFNVDRDLVPQDSSVGPGAQLYGNNAAFDSGLTLVAGGIDSGNFLQMQTFGGTASTYAVNTAGLDGIIAGNGKIPTSTYAGVLNNNGAGISAPNANVQTLAQAQQVYTNDGISQYFASFAQERDFSIGPKETVLYTVSTTLGQSIPITLRNALGGTTVAVTGDFALNATAYNYDFSTSSITLEVDRYGGSSGAATVNVAALLGSTPSSAITVTPSVLNFADGQTAANVTLTINSATAGLQPSNFSVALSVPPTTSTATGSAAVFPSVATVNVLPKTPVFTFSASSYAATAAQTGGALTVTINRSGNLIGPASVIFSTVNGTAVAGTDFTAVTQRVDFADGQATATVTVPILLGAQDLSYKAFSLNLTGTTPDGTGTGLVSLTPTPTAPVSFLSADVAAPYVASLSTVANTRSILSVVLSFSKALRGPGDLSEYALYTRSSEGAGGAARLKAVPLRSVSFNAATNTVSVVPAKPLAFNTNYQIVVKPSPSLTDLAGNTLNQNPGNVSPNYVAYFSRDTKATYVDAAGNNVTLTMKLGTFDLVRATDGQAASVTLFGTGPGSIFSGSVKKVGKLVKTTTIGTISNAASGTIALPATITLGA
jgi:hypothetical protein